MHCEAPTKLSFNTFPPTFIPPLKTTIQKLGRNTIKKLMKTKEPHVFYVSENVKENTMKKLVKLFKMLIKYLDE